MRKLLIKEKKNSTKIAHLVHPSRKDITKTTHFFIPTLFCRGSQVLLEPATLGWTFTPWTDHRATQTFLVLKDSLESLSTYDSCFRTVRKSRNLNRTTWTQLGLEPGPAQWEGTVLTVKVGGVGVGRGYVNR